MNVPVQSEFTVYVPIRVADIMLPLAFDIPVDGTSVSVEGLCTGLGEGRPGGRGGDESCNCVGEGALQGGISASFVDRAFAVGAIPRASAVTAATVKVFAMVVRFMRISFIWSIKVANSGSPATNKESRG